MRLSVVVTVVDAGEALERCLTSLAEQQAPPALEVIVPWDDSVPDIPSLVNRFPTFRFLSMGQVPTAGRAQSASAQHELFDKRRAIGVGAATGEVVAILEDRGVPRADWARTMVRVHEQLPHGVIGGAIENGIDRTLNWAVYFCDFGRYQRPFAAGSRDWVSDVNVGYKRRVLDRTRELWRDRYHETTVHWALLRSGETLYVTPDLIVDQVRGGLRLRGLIAERFAWGRLFAHTRARESALPKRLALALSTPLLPALLFARHARLQIGKRVTLARFVSTSPAVIVLVVAWSIGEAVGYLAAQS